MKSVNRITVSIVLLTALFINACQKDDSTKTTTSSSSTTDNRDVYVGSWKCSEKNTSKNTSSSFTVVVSKSNISSDQLLFSNFTELGSSSVTSATLNGKALTFDKQTVTGFTIEGLGTIDSYSLMNLKYKVDENQGKGPDSYTATLTR